MKLALGIVGALAVVSSMAMAQAQNWKGDSDDLAKAMNAVKNAEEAAAVGEQADEATGMSIFVQTEGGRERAAPITVLPTDSEWAAVKAAVKSLSAKRVTKYKADLTTMKITVEEKAAEPEAKP
jgi:hypothetical protein